MTQGQIFAIIIGSIILLISIVCMIKSYRTTKKRNKRLTKSAIKQYEKLYGN